jgi:hypothetical protein
MTTRDLIASNRTHILALWILLVSFLTLEAFFDREAAFLMPNPRATWLLAPYRFDHGTVLHYREAVFRRQVELPRSRHIRQASVRIKAAKAFTFAVNDVPLSSPDEAEITRNWNAASYYSIAEHLDGSEVCLTISVRSTNRTPALLAVGSIHFTDGATLSLDSGSNWQVSTDGGGTWGEPEFPGGLRSYYDGHLQPYYSHPVLFKALRIISTALTLALLILALWLAFGRSPPPPLHRDFSTSGSFLARELQPPAQLRVAIAFLILIYMPLTIAVDPNSGWDAAAHIEYVKWVATNWTVPFTQSGWEMHQPPLYYFIAAVFYRVGLGAGALIPIPPDAINPDLFALKFVQLVTPMLAFLQIMMVMRIVAYFVSRENKLPLPTVLFVCLLPMQIYISQFITNEVMASFFITLSLYCLIRLVDDRHFSWKWSFYLGASAASACLSKYTAFLILMSAGYVYASCFVTQKTARTRITSSILIVSLIVLCLVGPFLFLSYFHYPPASRTELSLEYFGWRFFLDPTFLGLGAVDKYVSRTLSFIDGNYSSFWLDQSQRISSWTRIFDVAIYFLAIFPTVLILYGATRGMSRLRDQNRHAAGYFAVMVFVLISIGGYVAFVMHSFSYEIVKAFYMLSLAAPLALFFTLGFREIMSTGMRGKIFAYSSVTAFAVVFSYYLVSAAKLLINCFKTI